MAGSKKYSVSLPEDIAEAVRTKVGSGGFSAYVAEALEHRIAMDKLGEIVADFGTDHEPLDQHEIDEARAALRNESGGSAGAAA